MWALTSRFTIGGRRINRDVPQTAHSTTSSKTGNKVSTAMASRATGSLMARLGVSSSKASASSLATSTASTPRTTDDESETPPTSQSPAGTKDSSLRNQLAAPCDYKQCAACRPYSTHLEACLQDQQAEAGRMDRALEDVASVKERLMAENEALRGEKEALLRKNEGLREENQTLLGRNMTLLRDNEVFDRENKNLENKLFEQRDFHHRCQRLANQLRSLQQSQLEEAREKYAESLLQVTSFENTIVALQNELSECKKTCTTIGDDLAHTQEKLEHQEHETSMLQQKVKEMADDHHDALEVAHYNMKETDKKLDDLEKRNELLEAEMRDIHQRSKDNTSELLRQVSFYRCMQNVLASRSPVLSDSEDVIELVKLSSALQEQNDLLRQDKRLQLKDIQNLAIENLQQAKANKKLWKQMKAVRTGHGNAVIALENITGKYNRTQQLLMDIEARNQDDFTSSSERLANMGFAEACRSVFASAVVRMSIANGLMGAHVKEEQLRERIDKLESDNSELLGKYNKVENELDEYIHQEQFRRRELRSAEDKVVMAEVQAKNQSDCIQGLRGQLQAFESRVAVEEWEQRGGPWFERWLLKCSEFGTLAARLLPLQHELNSVETKYAREVKALNSQISETYSAYEKLQKVYFDVAVHETERLHKEIAFWKHKCGVKHTAPQRMPESKLVHNRRILGAALEYGPEDMDPKDIPLEAQDPDFVYGWCPALVVAIKKLMPGVVVEQQDDDTYRFIRPTIPILTEAGELNELEDHVGTKARVHNVLEELRELDAEVVDGYEDHVEGEETDDELGDFDDDTPSQDASYQSTDDDDDMGGISIHIDEDVVYCAGYASVDAQAGSLLADAPCVDTFGGHQPVESHASEEDESLIDIPACLRKTKERVDMYSAAIQEGRLEVVEHVQPRFQIYMKTQDEEYQLADECLYGQEDEQELESGEDEIF